MGCLTEKKWCARADGRAGGNSTVSWWHNTMDHGLLVMLLLFAVESATFHVWAQGTEVVTGTAREFRDVVRDSMAKNAEVVKAVGLKAE